MKVKDIDRLKLGDIVIVNKGKKVAIITDIKKYIHRLDNSKISYLVEIKYTDTNRKADKYIKEISLIY